MQRYSESTFIGLDSREGAHRFPPGIVQQADNVLCDNGNFVSRPGVQGLLPAGFTAGTITQIVDYRRSDTGALVLIFARASKLWKWTVGTGVQPTEILNNGTSFNFANSGKDVRFARHGKYLYGIDGSASLFRVSLESSDSGAYAGLAVPTSSPTATLANSVINAITDPVAWKRDTLASVGNQLYNPSFTISGAGDTPPTQASGWTDSSGGVVISSSGVPAGMGTAVRLDVPGDNIFTKAYLNNYQKSNANESPTLTPRWAVHFEVGGKHYFKYSTDQLIYTIVAYSDTGGVTEIARNSISFDATPTTTGTVLANQRKVISFAGVTTPIKTYRLYIGAGGSNMGAGDGPYITDAFAHPVVAQSLTQANAGHVGFSGLFTQPNQAFQFAYFGGLYYELSLGGVGTDFSKYSNITLGITQNLPIASFPARLAFRETIGGTRVFTNPLTLSEDGTTLSVDISTIPIASRDSVLFVDLAFDADIELTGAPAYGYDFIFTLGPLTDAGNLSVGRTYTYLFEEVKTVAGTDIIQSSGSPLSAGVIATTQYAQTDVLLPAVVNTGVTDSYIIFRGGGVFDDGFYRKLAIVPVGSNATGPNWTWNFSTKIFRDNIPDSQILLALFDDIYQVNRDNFPTGLTSIAVYNGRLFASKDTRVWASWLLDADNQSGLYTSFENDPQDPSLAIKGAYFVLGGDSAGGAILSLTPLSSAIVAIRKNGITNLEGYDPTNFATVDRYIESNNGGIAPCSACLDPIRGGISYLSASGVARYNLDVPRITSRRLDGYFGLGRAASLSADLAYKNAAMVVYDERLFLLAPTLSTDTANNVVYVYDERGEGWTRWPNLNFASVTASGDAVYFGGTDGQIYTLLGDADKVNPAASNVAITITIKTRQYGDDAPQREKHPERYYFEAETAQASVSLSLSVLSDVAPWTQAYTTQATGGLTAQNVRVSTGCRGKHHSLGISVAVTAKMRIRLLALDASLGKLR